MSSYKKNNLITVFIILATIFMPVKSLNIKEVDLYHIMHLENITGTKKVEAALSDKKIDTHKEKYMQVWVTAYSSSEEETDDTPFITASNKYVNDGFVAANFLPFGTKIKIPSLFGNKIFIVEDRMSEKRKNFIDIWMPTKEDAKKFGIHYTTIIILEEENKEIVKN
jgi:3D (Asp-Asp-Asp) domain-containing protein